MIDIEDAFSWLKSPDAGVNGYQSDLLITTLREKIINNYRSGNLIQAYQMIDYLEASARELDRQIDIGDVWVEIGMAYFQMGNINKAEEFWTKAAGDYPVNVHEQAVALWLLGSVQWLIEKKNISAMNNWKESIREIGELADEAERLNLPEVKAWYEDRIREMEESLRDQILNKFP